MVNGAVFAGTAGRGFTTVEAARHAMNGEDVRLSMLDAPPIEDRVRTHGLKKATTPQVAGYGTRLPQPTMWETMGRPGKGFIHSSTFRLNVSAFRGIGGAFRVCSRVVLRVFRRCWGV